MIPNRISRFHRGEDNNSRDNLLPLPLPLPLQPLAEAEAEAEEAEAEAEAARPAAAAVQNGVASDGAGADGAAAPLHPRTERWNGSATSDTDDDDEFNDPIGVSDPATVPADRRMAGRS